MQRDFQLAVDTGDVEAVRALIDSGADVDALDRHSQTGLMRAATRGRIQVVRLLVERGGSLDVTAKYGLSALMLAVVNHHQDVAIALVEAGADLGRTGSGAPGFAGFTALDLARSRDLTSVVAAIEDRVPLERGPGG